MHAPCNRNCHPLLLCLVTGVALLFTAHAAPAAQQPAATPLTAAPSPDLAGIAHIALRVHDLDASVAFYEKLGFVRAFALSRDGQVYEAFLKINDRQFIELYPATPRDSQLGFLHLCFEGNDLQSVHDYYVAHGLTPKDVKTAGAGNLLFTMPGPLTPSGPQNMEYTQYMPGSLHSKDFGQHLGPDRIATQMTSVTLATENPTAASEFYVSKIGFTKSTKSSAWLSIPGAGNQGILLVPDKPLGLKSRITLGLGAMKRSDAEAALRKSGIAFTAEPDDALKIQDPDQNEILLAGTHVD